MLKKFCILHCRQFNKQTQTSRTRKRFEGHAWQREISLSNRRALPYANDSVLTQIERKGKSIHMGIDG